VVAGEADVCGWHGCGCQELWWVRLFCVLGSGSVWFSLGLELMGKGKRSGKGRSLYL
jgi:hypothetical protein